MFWYINKNSQSQLTLSQCVLRWVRVLHSHSRNFAKRWDKSILTQIIDLYMLHGANYSEISRLMSLGQWQCTGCLCRLMGFIIDRLLRQFEIICSKSRNEDRIPEEQMKQILHILTRKYSPRYLVISQQFRQQLGYYLKKQCSGAATQQQKLLLCQAYRKWRNNLIRKLFGNLREMRFFQWTDKQIYALYQSYAKRGSKLYLLKRDMIKQFGTKQKYDVSLVHSRIITFLGAGLRVLEKGLYVLGQTLGVNSTASVAKEFFCSNLEPEFEKVIKLASMAFGKTYPPPELQNLKLFVTRFLGQERVRNDRSKKLMNF